MWWCTKSDKYHVCEFIFGFTTDIHPQIYILHYWFLLYGLTDWLTDTIEIWFIWCTNKSCWYQCRAVAVADSLKTICWQLYESLVAAWWPFINSLSTTSWWWLDYMILRFSDWHLKSDMDSIRNCKRLPLQWSGAGLHCDHLVVCLFGWHHAENGQI